MKVSDYYYIQNISILPIRTASASYVLHATPSINPSAMVNPDKRIILCGDLRLISPQQMSPIKNPNDTTKATQNNHIWAGSDAYTLTAGMKKNPIMAYIK